MRPIDQVREILTLDGWKQERLAEELGVSQSTVHRWLTGSEPRGDKRDEIAVLYARLTGNADIEDKVVQLAGYVGAGQHVFHFEDGNAGYVEAPPKMTDLTTAVEVRGSSMLPLYEDGTVLYYSRQLPPDTMIGRQCIVHLSDGRVLVKRLLRGSGPGLYTLTSLNAEDIADVAVEWAAPIDWIKPRH